MANSDIEIFNRAQRTTISSKNTLGIDGSSLASSELVTDTNNALFRIPVFLSYAAPYNSLQSAFLDSAIEQLKSNLLFPRTLGRSDQNIEPPLTAIRRMVISSYGLIAFAFKRSFITRAVVKPGSSAEQTYDNFWQSSPYLQIEPSMAYQNGLPVAIFVENGVSINNVFGGILQIGAAPFNIVTFNLDSNADISDFFSSVYWKEVFLDWAGSVRACYNKRTQPSSGCEHSAS